MISLPAALEAYARHITALPPVTLPLTDALGRVLAAPVCSAIDLPRYSQSALDGYVMTAEDAARAPCMLTIGDTIAAGDTRELTPLRHGECQRIFTGARVPPQAGAVVAQERVQITGTDMHLPVPLKAGANIRWQGEEARSGTEVAQSGQTLTPALIASLANAGAAVVSVRRAPRITVLVSGDELRPLGTALEEGQIWDSNGPLVMTWLRHHGYEATVSHLGDEREAVTAALRDALEHSDLIITTGGVSVGDKDHILPAAESLGVRRVFWQVAQKPGKPLYFGQRDGCVLMGLPGNPAAVLIGLTLHVRTVLDRLSGAARTGPQWRQGRLVSAVKCDAQRDRLVRMWRDEDDEARVLLHPLPHQDSHMMSNLNEADALVWIPASSSDAAAGRLLRWIPLHD